MDFYVNENTVLLKKIVRWTINIVLALVCAWFLVYSFCTQVPVSGDSMQPVLDADDVVLVNRLIYGVRKSERYDIVVLEREDHKKNVERITGLPSETVQIKGGYMFTDGKLLSTGDDSGQMSLTREADTPIKLEDDEYFLLGDNRDSSEDNRFSNIGNIKKEQIQGKVWFRMLPLLKLDSIHSR